MTASGISGVARFCTACGKRIEWHQTKAGRDMPIDPDPHPKGRFAFDQSLRLARQIPGSKPRMYRCHFDTCEKKGQAPRRAAFVCNHSGGCDRSDRHAHCYRCGATDHLASDCDEESQ